MKKILNVIGILAMAVGALKIFCLSIPLFKSDISQLSKLSQSAPEQVYSSMAWFMAGLIFTILSEICIEHQKRRG